MNSIIGSDLPIPESYDSRTPVWLGHLHSHTTHTLDHAANFDKKAKLHHM